MRGKLMFLGGVAAGFVLGARAGREKYNELVANARKVWDHPTVQEAAGVVQAQANRLYTESKDTVSDKLSHTKVGERLSTRAAERDALAGATTAPETTPASGTTTTKSSTNNTTF
jgi:hypothetical protein